MRPLPSVILCIDLSVNMRDDINGITVKATNSEHNMAKDMVMAMGAKIIEASPSTKTMGRKTAINVIVAAITALLTSEAPVTAASMGGKPRLRWR